MTPKYFDVHSHIQFSQFEKDRAEVLDGMKKEGVFTIVVGTDKESSQRACDMISPPNGIFAAVGLHPNDVFKETFDEEYFKALADRDDVVAIGECGLDFFRTKPEKEKIAKQKEVLEKHIAIAVDLKKPLMIHCRNAHDDVIDLFTSKKKEYGEKLRGNIHFFTGDVSTAKKYFNLDFTISFTGVLTFTHDYDDVVKYAPLESILSETDCPFAAPVPYRGGRNEPVYVKEVVKRIAEIRGEDFETIQNALVSNAKRVFNL